MSPTIHCAGRSRQPRAPRLSEQAAPINPAGARGNQHRFGAGGASRCYQYWSTRIRHHKEKAPHGWQTGGARTNTKENKNHDSAMRVTRRASDQDYLGGLLAGACTCRLTAPRLCPQCSHMASYVTEVTIRRAAWRAWGVGA